MEFDYISKRYVVSVLGSLWSKSYFHPTAGGLEQKKEDLRPLLNFSVLPGYYIDF